MHLGLEKGMDRFAIIGMSIKAPQSNNYQEFWKNILNQKECINTFHSTNNENYIPKKGIIEDAELFEPELFGITPTEAKLMDPQLRLLLELVWCALEDSGYKNEEQMGTVSLILGQNNIDTYIEKVVSQIDLDPNLFPKYLRTINRGTDFLTTKIAYLLNFTGLCYSLQTACSTSLVAVTQACELLKSKQSDIAIAGGINVTYPLEFGYHYEKGLILSGNGVCRPFDKMADGTILSNGGGVIVLKRYADALTDNDHIHGIIAGYGVNNDGNNKAGYASPSIDGQKKAILKALSAAGKEPRDIAFIEAHGTGTPTGDPVEVAALAQAYSEDTAISTNINKILLTSIKANFGHLDVASGIAGLIKATLCLKHRTVPGQLHFNEPNPLLKLDKTSLYIDSNTISLTNIEGPISGAVSSFGIGGTNAHVILEEAASSEIEKSKVDDNSYELVSISGRTINSLNEAVQLLRNHINDNHSISIKNIAYTLQHRDRALANRVVFIAKNKQQLNELIVNFLSSRNSTSLDYIYISDTREIISKTCLLSNIFSANAFEKFENEMVRLKSLLLTTSVDFKNSLLSIAVIAQYLKSKKINFSFQAHPELQDIANYLNQNILPIVSSNHGQQPLEITFVKKMGKQLTLMLEFAYSKPFDLELMLKNCIAKIWILGFDIEFYDLLSNRGRRIPLFNYPFDKTKYTLTDYLENFPVTNIQNKNLGRFAISTEKRIENIFTSILGTHQVINKSDFFELGGDSILAISLIDMLSKELNINIEMEQLYLNSTPEKLSHLVTSNSDQIELATKNDSDTYAPSSLQKSFFFLERINISAKSAYNIPIAFHYEGALNLEFFQKAFNIVINNHICLQTYYEEKDGTLNIRRSKISIEESESIVEIEVVDISDLQSTDATSLLVEAANYKFDLCQFPLFLCKIYMKSTVSGIILFNFHHSIFDGQSIHILIDNLTRAYNSIKNNTKLSLRNENETYQLYSQSEQSYLANNDYLTQLENYYQYTHNFNRIKLVTDHPRRKAQSLSGRRKVFDMELSLVNDIYSFVENNKITLFMELIGAFAILLSKYSTETKFIIGAPVSLRSSTRYYNTIGPLINTVAFFFDIDTNHTIHQYIQSVKATCVKAMNYRKIPFSELVNRLGSRATDSQPVLQFTFNLHESEQEFRLHLDQITTQYSMDFSQFSQFEITYNCIKQNNSLKFIVEYSDELYTECSIDGMFKSFVSILKQFHHYPSKKIIDINLVTANHYRNLYNSTENLFPDNFTNIFDGYFSNVQNNPNATALIYNGDVLSYQQLNTIVDNFASVIDHHITIKNSENISIAVMLERNVDLIACLLAALKLGLCYIPIASDTPLIRVNQIIEALRPDYIFLGDDLFDESMISLPKERILHKQFPNKEKLLSNPVTVYNLARHSLKSEAYRISTTGSTGTPKGVCVSHENVINLLFAFKKELSLPIKFSFLVNTSISFDIFVLECFLPLFFGGTAILSGDNNIAQVAKLIKKEQPHYIQATPYHWNLLINELQSLDYQPFFIVGGDTLTPKLAAKLKLFCKKLYNVYGPTETCVWSTIHEITDPDQVRIGKPISNTLTLVLDDRGHILPANIEGNLYIGGKGVTLGYFNDQTQTKLKFIKNPFPELCNQFPILYNTGDIAYYNNDNDLFFQRRSGHFVKVRGFRINLHEIRNAILTCSRVEEVVVLIDECSDLGVYCSAYFTATDASASDCENIKKEILIKLKEVFPTYMIPDYIIPLRVFPTTTNGKIDTNNLKMYHKPKDNKFISDSAAAKSPLSDIIKGLVEEILEVTATVNDNLFTLGLTSFKAMTLHKKLEMKGYKLNIADIFQYITIKDLAAYLSENNSENTANSSQHRSKRNYNRLRKTTKITQ